jgi:Anti-sigma-K factor rskA
MEVVESDARPAGEAPGRPLRERLGRLVPSLTSMRPGVAWVSAAFLLAMGILGGWGITQLTDSQDSRVITAQVDKGRVPTGTATLVVPEEGDDGAILRVNGMPSLPSSGVYQVWLQRDGEVVSQGLFSVGEDGRGSAAVSDRLTGAEAVLVTREGPGGAMTPSEKPILRVTL